MAKFTDGVDHRADLMHKMMDRLHVDPTAQTGLAAATTLGAASRACAFCGHEEACERWFEAGAKGNSYKKFCPNADRFEALAAK